MSHRPTATVEDDDVADRRGSRAPRPGAVLIFSGVPTCRAWSLEDGPLVIGRDAPADIRLGDERASREPARVAWTASGLSVRDLGSRNGTFVGGRPVGDTSAPGRLLVRIGQSLLLLLADASPFLDRDPPVTTESGMVVGPLLAEVLARAARTARGGDALLITGESGAGKELIARHYHVASGATGAFVAVNSAAIPEAIAERLLFGAVKGSYSGASADAAGYLQEAHGGTLFLDELGELPPPVQSKLLRALETREVTPVGGTKPRSISFGLVTATNRDVRAEVAVGRFRADLYYRIGRARVAVPALRDRPEEIPWLIADELGAIAPGLGAHARLVERCCLARWPGNARELRSEIRAAGLEAHAEGSEMVMPEHLSEIAGQAYQEPAAASVETVAAIGADSVEAALATAQGNVSAAARALGIHRNQLYRLMERHGIKGRTGDG